LACATSNRPSSGPAGYSIVYPTDTAPWYPSASAAALAEDVRDHRLNTRTVKLNPFFRFLYFNMNYHIEHHMYPMVPFHALPTLHQRIQKDMPRPYNGLVDAFKEIVPVLIRQSRDASYFLVRELPEQSPYGFSTEAKSQVYIGLPE
jgi:fatty acid desaturase